MKTFKRILASLIVAVMVITVAPLSSFAGLKLNPDWLNFDTKASATTSGTCGENLVWSYDTALKTLTISGSGVMNNYQYSNQPWADYKYDIQKVIVEGNVTSIGKYAFYSCSSITDVTIADTVEVIGAYAFQDCTKLEYFHIPQKVKSIGGRAFDGCCNLTKFTVDSNNQFFSADEHGVLFNKDKTSLINYPIGNRATDYSVPDSVKIIENASFDGCKNLTSITVSKNIISIEDHAFNNCSNIKKVNVSDLSSWCNIDFGITYANPMCNEADLYLNNQKVTELVIPDNVKEIKPFTFYCCTSITKVVIPDNVTKIGSHVFVGCINLKTITIPETVTAIGNNAFAGCQSLETVELPDSIKTIGMYAFLGCSNLKDIKLPDGLTALKAATFQWCRSLKSITIPVSLESIEQCAFDDCTSLTDVYYLGTKEQWEDIKIDTYLNTPLLNATIHFATHTHKYVTNTIAPTCTKNGHTTYICECGDNYVADYVDATGHTSDKWIYDVLPSIYEVGKKHKECTVCGEEFEKDTVAEKVIPDANGDGKINSTDALIILNISVGKIKLDD